MDLKSSLNFQKLLSKVSSLSSKIIKLNSKINLTSEYINSRISSVDEYNKVLLKRIESLEKTVADLKKN